MDFERLYMNGKINVQKGNSGAIIFFFFFKCLQPSSFYIVAHVLILVDQRKLNIFPTIRPARIRERREQNELEDDHLLIYLLSPTRQ